MSSVLHNLGIYIINYLILKFFMSSVSHNLGIFIMVCLVIKNLIIKDIFN